ncbi:MAG: hypothetical protein CMJ83_14125 [Planctomycetes bacterium]|nr:hypothetical protein [Planctomycetota bacterium]
MSRTLSIATFAVILATSLTAQTGDLAGAGAPKPTLSLSGTITPGDTVVVGVITSQSLLPVYLGISLTAGPSSYDMGLLGTLHLDLPTSLVALPVGMTGVDGDVWATFPMPVDMACPPAGLCFLQAVVVYPTSSIDGDVGTFGTSALGTVAMGADCDNG